MITKRFDEQGERVRALPMTRVVKETAGERRAPVSELAGQSASFNVGLHDVLRNECNPESGPSRPDTQWQFVESDLSVDAHLHLAPRLLEFPRIEPAQ